MKNIKRKEKDISFFGCIAETNDDMKFKFIWNEQKKMEKIIRASTKNALVRKVYDELVRCGDIKIRKIYDKKDIKLMIINLKSALTENEGIVGLKNIPHVDKKSWEFLYDNEIVAATRYSIEKPEKKYFWNYNGDIDLLVQKIWDYRQTQKPQKWLEDYMSL